MRSIRIIVLLSLLFEIHSQIISIEDKLTLKKTTKSENLFQKLQKDKKSLHSIHEKKDRKGFKKLVDDVLSSGSIENLNKERKTEDTKAILGYMMSSLYNKNQNKKNFEIDKFFDQILSQPDEVLPNGLFEGDIVISKDQAEDIFSEHDSEDGTRYKRKVINSSTWRWKMPINYMFDGSHTETEKSIIRLAFQRWENQTCITFRENTDAPTTVKYMRIIKGDGCYSSVGYWYWVSSGYQDLSLGNGCVTFGIALHEIGHYIGLWHEQSRADRDNFIKVMSNNIEDSQLHNFEKHSASSLNGANTYGLPYDYASDMHYNSDSFKLTDGLKTIETLDPDYQKTIGNRLDLSFLDVKAANLAYCQATCTNTLSCQRNGYINPRTCNSCICPDGFTGTLCETLDTSSPLCGGTFTTAGTIKTPNYPSAYPVLSKCFWHIKAPVGQRIQLTFNSKFSVTCSSNVVAPCSRFDWVEIRSKINEFEVGGPRFCCSTAPSKVFESDKNEMMILFYSTVTSSYNSYGFQASFTFK